MKRFFSTVVACAMFGVAQAQESAYTEFPKAYEIEKSSEWTSELLTFEEPIEGIRITYFSTSTSGTYNGFPYIDLAELDIINADGNEVAYTVTTNSLATDGDGLDALNDNDNYTYYHSAYSGAEIIAPFNFVYLDIAFETPQTAFSYKQIRRNYYNANYPTSFVFSALGEEIVDMSGHKGLKYSVETQAQTNTSGVLQEIGLTKVNYVTELKVKGTINSYDLIVFRDKMPYLHTLDLSETTVVASTKAFYDNYCTEDNDLGCHAFDGMDKLHQLKLPKGLTTIRQCAFYSCDNLGDVEIPSTVLTIEDEAFSYCHNLKKVVIPKGVKKLGGGSYYGPFYSCNNLKSVSLPEGLETITSRTFYNCDLDSIILPPTIKTIGEKAFSGNSSLTEIRIPSSVETIENYAFSSCSNLSKVYTYTVEPTTIYEETFDKSVYEKATLYVPSVSLLNYYWDTGWKRFLNLATFDEPYDYFYVNNDYTLNDDTGYIEGEEGKKPDVDINAGGGLIVEGSQEDNETPNQNLGDVTVNQDGNGVGGSIIGDNNLHIDNLHIHINVVGGHWYFFAFPYDIKLDKISTKYGSDYVFRYYDGEERATNGHGGWKDIHEKHLKAARGYIFQCASNDVLILNIEDVRFKKEDKYNELVAHVSGNLQDASWNFMGNPYLSYYDMNHMGYSAPITVWDSSLNNYVAIRPGDDDYHFSPYEAFFVQKPEGEANVEFSSNGQMTYNQSLQAKQEQQMARSMRLANEGSGARQLINLILRSGDMADKTRVVFNEQQSLAYEASCDAAKFESAGVIQLYTLDNNVHYAINERPKDNGEVRIGYKAVAGGSFTIEAQRMDVAVSIKDNVTGDIHNFSEGAYTFTSEVGTFETRFTLLFEDAVTGIENVKADDIISAGKKVYDLKGNRVNPEIGGVYIVDGVKVRLN